MVDWLSHFAISPLLYRYYYRTVQDKETLVTQERDRKPVQSSETTRPHTRPALHLLQREELSQVDIGTLPRKADEGQAGSHPQAGTQTRDGSRAASPTDYINAYIQASAAGVLYQQDEVSRLLAMERYRPEPANSPLVPLVEEVAKAYKDSQGRGRDSRGVMLDIRV